MGLYQDWEALVENMTDTGQTAKFWPQYYSIEQEAYKKILGEKRCEMEGSLEELAQEFGFEPVLFAGFCDGINTSLEVPVNLDELTLESQISLNIIWEKLYFNMREAKAEWLYSLDEWEDILPDDKRREIIGQWRESKIVRAEKQPGRNDPCPCGSGKKYKHCCG